MAPMLRFAAALSLAAPLLAACTTARPEWLQQEDDACFRNRTFAEEIPPVYWGNPVRDPCWRYRGGRMGP
jgi:hypothetical protein